MPVGSPVAQNVSVNNLICPSCVAIDKIVQFLSSRNEQRSSRKKMHQTVCFNGMSKGGHDNMQTDEFAAAEKNESVTCSQ